MDSIFLFDNSFDLAVFIFSAAFKLSILLGCIYLSCRVFRRMSSANKHLIWITGLFSGLLFLFLLPVNSFEIPIFPAKTPLGNFGDNNQIPNNLLVSNQSSEVFSGSYLISTNGVTFEPNNYSVLNKIVGGLITIWLFGIIILLFRLIFGLITTKRRSKQAIRVTNPFLTKLIADLSQDIKLKRKVNTLISKEVSMPLVCGLWNSKILLPEDFEKWSEERQRVVLIHELAHIKRYDCLTQLMAQIICVIYWFNPFVWYAARQLRILRELASDDYVLRSGTKPSVYANHLLETTKLLRNKSFFYSSSTVAFAQKSQVKTRL